MFLSSKFGSTSFSAERFALAVFGSKATLRVKIIPDHFDLDYGKKSHLKRSMRRFLIQEEPHKNDAAWRILESKMLS